MGIKVAIMNITRGGMSGGYKAYLKNVVPRMAGHSAIDSILCATPASVNVNAFLGTLPNVQFVCCAPFIPFHYGPDRILWEHLKRFSPDVIFVPIERSFNFEGVPIINMVQNMAPMIYSGRSNSFGERIRNFIQLLEARKAARKSEHIIAVTNFVHDFLAEQWEIPLDRMSVIHYGRNVPPAAKMDNGGEDPIFRHLKGSFLFTVGSIDPFRGLEDLLMAVKKLVSEGIDVGCLVIAGTARKSMIRYKRKLQKWVDKEGLSTKVLWVGHLDEGAMSWCYYNCKAFVMTSRVESFGMIALEALSHGCVCIAADNPCLPEIFGSAALYYPPMRWEILVDRIKYVLGLDSQRISEISLLAKKRAGVFSWNVAVNKTVSLFEDVAERRMRQNSG